MYLCQSDFLCQIGTASCRALTSQSNLRFLQCNIDKNTIKAIVQNRISGDRLVFHHLRWRPLAYCMEILQYVWTLCNNRYFERVSTLQPSLICKNALHNILTCDLFCLRVFTCRISHLCTKYECNEILKMSRHRTESGDEGKVHW